MNSKGFKTLAPLTIVIVLFSISSLSASDAVEWTVLKTLKLEAAPIDVAVSADGKRIFVLTDQGMINVYSADAKEEGRFDIGGHVDKIKVGPRGDIVLANSGVTSDTSTLGAYVAQIRKRDPEAFEKNLKTITEQAFEMKNALEAGELEKVGALMTENHKILIDMGLSHEKLIYLCNFALEKGALGAKVTGGGRGGYMSALTPDKAVQNEIASTMEDEGYKVIRATIGEN